MAKDIDMAMQILIQPMKMKMKMIEHSEIESAKAEFGRRMKNPQRLTEPKEGTGVGDLRYASWEKFKP